MTVLWGKCVVILHAKLIAGRANRSRARCAGLTTITSCLASQALILLLAEDEERLVLAAWGALDALASTVPKEDAPSHVAAVKEAVLGAKEKVRRTVQCYLT